MQIDLNNLRNIIYTTFSRNMNSIKIINIDVDIFIYFNRIKWQYNILLPTVLIFY